MMPFPPWFQQSSERHVRVGARLGLVTVLGILSIGAASVIALSPLAGSLIAGTVAVFFLTEYVLPPTWATSAPLIVLFMTPGDALTGLSDDWRGLFMLAGGTFLATSSFLRGRFRVDHRVQVLLPGLAAMYLTFFAIHASNGALRGGAFWIAAVGVWTWLDGRMAADPAATRRGIENAFILIGAFSGGVGTLEFFGVIDPAQWIPDLSSSDAVFTQEIGRRVAGFSGHPLCFGTLCMLGCGLAAIRFVVERQRLRSSPWLVAGLIASGAGLVLSGARGSWLALFCGLALALAATLRSRIMSGATVIRGSILVGAIAGLVVLSGLGFIVRERLVGAASAPMSFGQRVMAAQTILDSLPDLPFLGVGPGGASEFMVRGGSVVPNIENEYLIALVLGGPIAMLGLIAFCLMTIRIAFSEALVTGDPGPLVLIGAISVNIATFNFFSWPIGPPLLATVTGLAVLTRRTAAGSSRGPLA